MNRSVFSSINDNLIQNKCWLCDRTFMKGKIRKVFQVTDILRYYHERYVSLVHHNEKVVTDEALPSSDHQQQIDNTRERFLEQEELKCELISTNFRKCYKRYEELQGNISKIEDELRDIDCAVCMSGLACCSTDECDKEYKYIMPDDTSLRVQVTKLPSSESCPPGCGCDNPWPFLRSGPE